MHYTNENVTYMHSNMHTRVHKHFWEKEKCIESKKCVALATLHSVRSGESEDCVLAIVASWLDELAQAGTFYHMEQFAQVYFWLLKITIDITR